MKIESRKKRVLRYGAVLVAVVFLLGLGFTPPFHLWLLGLLRELMEERLSEVKRSGMVEPEGIDHVGGGFLREPRTAAWSRAWALVTLGFWLRKPQSAPAPRLHNCANVPV
ncbi:MAG: hypothetical protein Q8P12_00085 [bacterium]|nr:hypothetical protein [bacterium]